MANLASAWPPALRLYRRRTWQHGRWAERSESHRLVGRREDAPLSPSYVLDGPLALRHEAAVAALCARVPAPGPRHHGAPAAGLARRAGARADRRRRHPGALVLPAEGGIPPCLRREPPVCQPDQTAYVALAELTQMPLTP